MEKEEPKVLTQIINVGPASFDKFSIDGKGERVWTARWKSAIAHLYDGGDFAGRMTAVDGSIYQDSKEVSTFAAASGEAVKASETLTLREKVTLTAKESGVTLTCDELVYEAKKKLIKAKGRVRIEGKMGVISGVNEIWTTPELKMVATPDMWGAKV